ncbi:uncharacterized protein LOC113324375 [Papaver somniferum]|uniref:uncharacterized protein LOC113324375 n=1 Tax=Papaver somniferum TaxID=3469 RepID=UPI000E70186C|nr:uncharacterized protein LOC113324375 [Papaver somniferum]
MKNAAREEVWIRLFYEKQPFNLCGYCYTIDHKELECETIAAYLLQQQRGYLSSTSILDPPSWTNPYMRGNKANAIVFHHATSMHVEVPAVNPTQFMLEVSKDMVSLKEKSADNNMRSIPLSSFSPVTGVGRNEQANSGLQVIHGLGKWIWITCGYLKSYIALRDLDVSFDDYNVANVDPDSPHSTRAFSQSLQALLDQFENNMSGHNSTDVNIELSGNECVSLDVTTPSPNSFNSFHGSDHWLILLISETDSFKPINVWKFYRCWFRDPQCSEVIANSWDSSSEDLNLSQKLCNARRKLSIWNREYFGKIGFHIKYLKNQLSFLQDQPYSEVIYQKIHLTIQRLNYWKKMEADFLQHKSWDRCLKDSYRNTAYFHSLANRRRSRNHISSLRDNQGQWYYSHKDLETLLTRHFSSIDKSTNPQFNHNYFDIISPIISQEENESLISIPSEEEIFNVLKEMPGWNSPGPDGFTAGLFLSQWQTAGRDVVNLVQQLFISKQMPHNINNTVTFLIPKTLHPSTPYDYMPIGVCNIFYKIISKLVVTRIKPPMEKIIFPTQASYVPRRYINDNIVMAHELIHSMKESKKKMGLVALKLDMLKAFDKVEWCFIDKMPSSLGFCEDLRTIIFQCISTTTVSIRLNGSICQSYMPSRGLRQGDPLSPYLFIISMEYLARSLMHAEANSLLCADKLFEVFSFRHMRLSEDAKLDIRNKLGVKQLSSTDKYLGLPILLGESKSSSFKSIQDSKTLNQAARSTLVKSVLNSIPTDYMSNFRLPKNVIHKLDSVQRKFWWGHKSNHGLNIVAWNSPCAPLDDGDTSDEAQLRNSDTPNVNWRKLWKSNAPHKVKLFIWKCLKSIMPTIVKLNEYNSNIDTTCPICSQAEESLHHLLVQCDHSRSIWLALNINTASLQSQNIDIVTWIAS